MPHDFSVEVQAAFAAYAPKRKGTIVLPPPRFLRGPYFPPSVEIGQTVECARFDLVRVVGWSQGPIRWPQCQVSGRRSLILFEDLRRAVEEESATAVALAWGVCKLTVSIWRQTLDVESINAGTAARMTTLLPFAMTSAQRALGQRRARSLTLHAKTEATKRERGRVAGKRTWTPAQVALMGVLPDETIAAQIGCHTRTVGAERNRRGIASIQCAGTLPELQTIDGARVQARRYQLELSQQEVAQRMGCTRARVSHMETGRSHHLTPDTLKKLGRALQCAPTDLISLN